jgi:hypothetical protein
MAENRNTARLVEVGLNKYGQRLDEYNEFGQSLEAEVWHFDALAEVSVAPLPPLERLIRPAREQKHEVGLNKYGQRLDEYNEFGQSLEAEVWHFDALAEVSVAPLPPLERLIRPAREQKHEAGLNRYGQRLDEYNEFGQSLEAEVWHFDALAEVSVAPLPPLERLVRPARKKNRSAAGKTAETHRRAA